jgi:hypothetical protein
VAEIHFNLQVHCGDTTSDHIPLIGVLECEGKEHELGKRASWVVFTAIMSYVFTFWEKQWGMRYFNETYNNFVDFLVALAARCTFYFPLELVRPAVPYWLRKMLARSRSFHLRARRTGNVALRSEVCWLRKMARAQLKALRNEQLAKLLKERHKSGEGASPF